MKRKILILGLLMPFLFSSVVYAVDEGFPGRSEYPDVLVYEKSQLFDDFKDVVLVDTRSAAEFETLRIKGAINIPINRLDFAHRIKELRVSTTKPIVFYCHGRNCEKSYRAGRQANKLNIEDTYAYDAGVFDWAKTYPHHVIFLSRTPLDPKGIVTTQKPHPSQTQHISFAGP
jgi:rhodanese-related sulfurtransferase